MLSGVVNLHRGNARDVDRGSIRVVADNFTAISSILEL